MVSYPGGVANATLKVVHMKPDKTRTEYFAPAALLGVILIQDGPNSWEYMPREEIWEATPSRLLPVTDQVCQSACRNYDMKLLGVESVAGRPAFVIEAVPRCPCEAARRVWVDKQYFVILGTQVENAQRRVVSSSRFVHIELNSPNISASLFKVVGRTRPATTPSSKQAAQQLRQPAYLPKGYKRVAISYMSVQGHCCVHLQFSNGANSISLFERHDPRESGPIVVKGKVTPALTWAHDGIVFTVMGDLPESELQKIAKSVR